MNSNKAVEYLRESKCIDEYHHLKDMHDGALDTAVIALERQIPQIALKKELIETTYICPKCNTLNGYGFNYCFNCGQAIITQEYL